MGLSFCAFHKLAMLGKHVTSSPPRRVGTGWDGLKPSTRNTNGL